MTSWDVSSFSQAKRPFSEVAPSCKPKNGTFPHYSLSGSLKFNSPPLSLVTGEGKIKGSSSFQPGHSIAGLGTWERGGRLWCILAERWLDWETGLSVIPCVTLRVTLTFSQHAWPHLEAGGNDVRHVVSSVISQCHGILKKDGACVWKPGSSCTSRCEFAFLDLSPAPFSGTPVCRWNGGLLCMVWRSLPLQSSSVSTIVLLFS